MGRGIERKEIFFNDNDRSYCIAWPAVLSEEGSAERDRGCSHAQKNAAGFPLM